MNVDTDTQYAFHQADRGSHVQELRRRAQGGRRRGQQEGLDPRSSGKAGEAGVTQRVTHAAGRCCREPSFVMERDNLMAGPGHVPAGDGGGRGAAARRPSPCEVGPGSRPTRPRGRRWPRPRSPTVIRSWRTRTRGPGSAGAGSAAALGWHGTGPIPLEHAAEPGFLRSLSMLGRAGAIGEDDEAQRCDQFLRDSSPAAAAALRGSERCRRAARARGARCVCAEELRRYWGHAGQVAKWLRRGVCG